MDGLLDTQITLPLEREFEGWIMWQLQDYLQLAGIRSSVWAISPRVESTWPADEAVVLSGKIIGLQFKRPELANPLQGVQVPHFNRLHWNVGADRAQFALVKKSDEIFYCLPTFTNRDRRHESLHHCLFWRPTNKMGPVPIWYANPQVPGWSGSIEKHYSSLRWGAFFERLQQCEIGYRLPSGVVGNFNERLREQVGGALGRPSDERQSKSLVPKSEDGTTAQELLWLLSIEMETEG